MSKKEFIPTESQNYSPQFFLLCFLFLIAAAWALWDEIEVRRPWKSYQREFREIEFASVEEELKDAESNIVAQVRRDTGIDEPDAPDLFALETRLRESIEALSKDEAYREFQDQLNEIEREISHVTRDIRFARSEADELFYEWKHALRVGTDHEEFESAWYKNRERLEGLQGTMKTLEADRDTRMSEFEEHTKTLDKNQRALQELKAFRQNRDQRLETVRNRRPEIHQIVIEAFERNTFGQPEDRVDRCMSCHVAVDRTGFEDQPHPFRTHPNREEWFSLHPYETMGCTPCHGGQGPALVSAFFAHGYRNVSEEDGSPGEEVKEYLEHWDEPMLEGDHMESSCPLCHRTFEIDKADVLNRSKLLFTELGCHGCHFHKEFEEKAKIGPDLTRIRSKVYPEWLVAWLQDPRRYLPKTRMPNYQFDEEQVASIAAYLIEKSDPYEFAAGTGTQGSTERGMRLIESKGCIGCHSIGEKEAGGYLAPLGYDLVPDLSRIGEKVDREWVYDWLLDPKSFRPTTKMPNLNLTPGEANDISTYLLTLGDREESAGLAERLADPSLGEKGRKLIYDYGCYSCHAIQGFEGASRIAPPLTGFGNKDPTVELYFGDAVVNPEFRLVYGTDSETWENWTFNKLRNPRIYEDEVSESKMPAYDLSDENIHALLILLQSFNGRLAPEEYRRVLTEHEGKVEAGKNLVRTLNCIGCHPINGKGGDIRKFYDNIALAPPDLTGEGDKVQSDWLYEFLKKPYVLRPWLQMRMPNFELSDEQTATIVEYFNSMSKRKIPFSFFDVEKVSPESKELGRKLFGARGARDYATSLKCGSCHPKGRELPEGNPTDWGPDLFLARQRLKPEWFSDWLRNPQSLQEGTRMPNFFYDYDEFEGEVEVTELLPEPEVKIRALRDYIFSEGY
jgi:cbb3-type cytochrome oxidase cytochrome c subunit